MFDEGLLARALSRPPQDTSARELDEVMHLAQRAEYGPAAERAFQLIDAGCKDVRAFIVYALAVFAARGPAAVPSLFESVSALLPANRTSGSATRATDTALRFGFRTMRAHLDFSERRPEATPLGWTEHLGADTAASVARACASLRSALLATFDDPLCEAELGAVTTRLEAYCARSKPMKSTKVAPLAEAPAEPEAEVEPVSAVMSFVAPDSPPAPPAFARRAADYRPELGTLPISPALHDFIRKLQAFEHLLMSDSLAKAAIVASDIRSVITGFDPMTYLPALLSPHFRLLSQHGDALAAYEEHRSSPGGQALEQLYRVDLDAFLEA